MLAHTAAGSPKDLGLGQSVPPPTTKGKPLCDTMNKHVCMFVHEHLCGVPTTRKLG